MFRNMKKKDSEWGYEITIYLANGEDKIMSRSGMSSREEALDDKYKVDEELKEALKDPYIFFLRGLYLKADHVKGGLCGKVQEIR